MDRAVGESKNFFLKEMGKGNNGKVEKLQQDKKILGGKYWDRIMYERHGRGNIMSDIMWIQKSDLSLIYKVLNNKKQYLLCGINTTEVGSKVKILKMEGQLVRRMLHNRL